MRKIIGTYLMLLLVPLMAQNQYNINEISISTAGDTTFMLITTGGQADFKKFTMETPPRLGIDFFGGIYNLPQTEFSKLPGGIIAAVRGSQNQPAPKPLARVVLDLVESPKNINVRSHPEGVMIALHSPGYPQIKKWTSGKKAQTAAPADTIKTAAKPAPTDTAKTAAKPDTTTGKKPDTTAVPTIAMDEVPAELAIYLRPETLSYKGIVADKETIEVAKYIRNMVIYIPKGNDPFIRPLHTKKVPLGMEPLPVVENLTVVGIVNMEGKNVALLQDTKGFGYVVVPGDTVEGGTCFAITDTSAQFNIYEFGQVRKIELPLIKPKKNE